MARRPITDRVQCTKEGCREVAHFEYDSQRERIEAARRRKDHPYRCVRHSSEDEVLSASNVERTVVVTASPHPRAPGLYWLAEGQTSGSGFTYGPGFKAFANDFPEGTRLVISARIEAPSADYLAAKKALKTGNEGDGS